MKSKQLSHSIILLLTALIWGIAFVAQSSGGREIGPYSFNCIRSFIGSAFLIPVIILLDKLNISTKKPLTTKDKFTLLQGGILCGIALALASNVQQLGLYFGATAGKAGFLTACYILLVPILGLFIKRKCSSNIWLAVAIALVGLYMLCINDSFSFSIADLLLLVCALMFSFHIMIIDHFSPIVDGVRMSCIQFFVCGLITAIPMFFFEMNHSLSGIKAWYPNLLCVDAYIPIFYAGIMSCGIAYTLQIIGQDGLNPTVASLIMSFESVFSVIAGWILLDEKMGPRQLTGCLLIFIAVILAQLPISLIKKINNLLRTHKFK